jgi:hypothetical protein
MRRILPVVVFLFLIRRLPISILPGIQIQSLTLPDIASTTGRSLDSTQTSLTLGIPRPIDSVAFRTG